MDNIDLQQEEWIRSQWRGTVELAQVQKLLGGISSSMYRLDIRLGESNAVKSFVLRAVQPTDSLNEEQGILAQEAAVLRQLAVLQDAGQLKHLQVRFPRCIAYDAYGDCAGIPSLLMTYLQGQISLPQKPKQQWLRVLAQAIAPIHRATANNMLVPWNYYSYVDAAAATEHPALSWSQHPQRWRSLLDRIQQPAPSFDPCLIHRDYHPTNVLWNEEQDQVIGIVDWVSGCNGPAGIDVGHCRINLVQLYGVDAANTFLEAYLEANPEFEYDPYWDICCLLDMTGFGPIEVYEGWTLLGFQGLYPQDIQQRIEQYVEDLVQLLHANRYIK